MLIQSSLHATVTEAESTGASEPERAKVTELRFEPILNDFHLTVPFTKGDGTKKCDSLYFFR